MAWFNSEDSVHTTAAGKRRLPPLPIVPAHGSTKLPSSKKKFYKVSWEEEYIPRTMWKCHTGRSLHVDKRARGEGRKEGRGDTPSSLVMSGGADRGSAKRKGI